MATRDVVVNLRANVNDFTRQINAGTRSLDELARKAGQSAGAASTSMGRMVQSARLQKESWTTAGTALTAFGAVTVAALGASAKAAIDWESAWAGVQKTVDGSTTQLAALEDGLRGMAREMPATHGEIAAVAEAAGALGVATKDVEGFTKTMVMLGETTNLTAEDAATNIAQISNVMGTLEREGSAGVEKFAAALVHLGNNGASTEAEILAMAQRISATGSVIGLSEADVLGYANALSSVGINAEAGGTAISRVFMDIASAASQGGEELTSFANVAGMSATDFAKAFEEDPARAVATFIQGLGGISAAGGDVFGVLSDLGFSDIRVSQALLTMAESGDLLTESLEQGAQAWEDGSAAQDEYAKRLETTQAQMEIARNNITDAGISLGSVFLPAIAEVSGGVADFAGTLADLPEPMQELAGGLAGVAGVASLAAGGFLLLAPRALDTVTAMRELKIIGPGANAVLSGTVGAVGRLAMWGGAVGITAVALVAVANALHDPGVPRNAEDLADELVRIAGAGRTLKEVGLGTIFEELPSFVGMTTIEATNLKGVFDNLLDPDITDQASRIFGELGLPSYMKDTEEAAKAADEALASMLNAGGSEASTAVALIEGLGYSAEDLAIILPGVAELLDETGAASENAAGGVQVAGEAFGTANEALEEFLTNAGEAGAAFGGVLSAYQSVIDKNKEIAESTAAATESSKDSWEDYYDGTTVSMGDWLKSLDEQVAAVQSWHENVVRAGEQIRDEMPAHMQDAAAATVRSLIEAGPDGAAALAAFVNGTPEERQAIIEKQGLLGNDAGVAAANMFEEALHGAEPEPIPVEADTGPALYELNGVVLAVDEATGTVTIDGNAVPAVATLNDVLGQVGESAEDITINGNPVPANATLGELLALVRNSEEPVTIGGNNAEGAAALAGLVAAIIGTEENVKVDADTSPATGTVNNWRPLKTAYIKVDADLSSANYTVSNWNPGTKYADVVYTVKGSGVQFSPGKVGGPIADGLIEGRLIAAYAAGGAIYGPGTGTSDDVVVAGPRADVQYRLSNGEHVWTDAEVKAMGGHGGVYALREMARTGELRKLVGFAEGGAVGFATGGSVGYATGGQVGSGFSFAASFDVDFTDLLGAYQEVIEKNKEVARAAAEATESTEDSWEDFYNGTSVSADDWIQRLRVQQVAEQEWARSLEVIASRTSEGFAASLADMGESGRQLVMDMARMSDAQLSFVEGLYEAEAALDAERVALEQAAEARRDYVSAVASGSASFGGMSSFFRDAQSQAEAAARAEVDAYNRAVDRANEQRRTAAEDYADSTLNANDSWEDYYTERARRTYRGVSVELDDVLGQMRQSFNEMTTWRENLVLLSGQVSDEFLAELARMGQDGAPLVAMLVDATDEELAEFERLFGATGLASGEAFAEELAGAGEAIRKAGGTLGDEAVAGIAEQVALGESTVQAALNKWNLSVGANVTVAGAAVQGFASGGYTGDLGVNQVAGVVHGREFVFDAATTARYRPLFEAIDAGRGPMVPAMSAGPVSLDAATVDALGARIAREVLTGAGAVGEATARKAEMIARQSGRR